MVSEFVSSASIPKQESTVIAVVAEVTAAGVAQFAFDIIVQYTVAQPG